MIPSFFLVNGCAGGKEKNMKLLNAGHFIALFACCLLLLPIQAAAAPAQYVNDDAKLFSSSEVNELDARIEKSAVGFYLLTVDNAGSQSVSSLASNTFEDWALGGKDTLVVVAMDEGEIFMEMAIGGPLEKALFQSKDYGKGDP